MLLAKDVAALAITRYQRTRALAVFLRVSSRAAVSNGIVRGFRALYDTAKGPDSEFNEGPRGLFAPRLNLIQTHNRPASAANASGFVQTRFTPNRRAGIRRSGTSPDCRLTRIRPNLVFRFPERHFFLDNEIVRMDSSPVYR
jgi:hypothetical protein